MNEPFFYTAVKETQSDIPQPSWEAVLNQEATLSSGTVPQWHSDDVTENARRDIDDHPEEGYTGDKAKAVVKHMVTVELATLVEQSSDDILHTSYQNAQSGIRLVV